MKQALEATLAPTGRDSQDGKTQSSPLADQIYYDNVSRFITASNSEVTLMIGGETLYKCVSDGKSYYSAATTQS